MKVGNIKLGDILRHRTTPNYSYYKVIKILNPKQDENTNNFIVIKCHHSVNKDFSFSLVKYIRPIDLIKEIK